MIKQSSHAQFNQLTVTYQRSANFSRHSIIYWRFVVTPSFLVQPIALSNCLRNVWATHLRFVLAIPLTLSHYANASSTSSILVDFDCFSIWQSSALCQQKWNRRCFVSVNSTCFESCSNRSRIFAWQIIISTPLHHLVHLNDRNLQ